ncbi:MAG: glycosyltransferase family 2 protein [Deltaproteobacteria bacterium]|nr:glycosyltransferase family 2 protein [Deltaproteobacteria bacterium]
MKKAPVVSIVMPLYNKRSYVRHAIASVQQQTLPDWELIIIDDGSTDGSALEIPIDNKRIRLIQKKNAGPAAARNRGIREARGEFITFLDADDYYYPHKLETEMILLRKEKRAKWMISAFDREKDNEITLHRFYDIDGNELEDQVLLVDNALCELSIKGIPIDGLCVDRHLLLKLDGFNEEMRCFEISELMIRCALEQPKVLVYSKPLYRVFDVPGSAFKVSGHRIEGMRQMGEVLYNLSLRYPEFSQILTQKSRRPLLSYVTNLIHLGRKSEARECLVKKFPYPRDKKWVKLWILSWTPNCLLDLKFKNRPQ